MFHLVASSSREGVSEIKTPPPLNQISHQLPSPKIFSCLVGESREMFVTFSQLESVSFS